MAGPAPYVSFTGGVDLRALQLHRIQPQRDARCVQLSFALWHAEYIRLLVRFVARIKGDVLRGACRSNDDPPMAWDSLRFATPRTDPQLR